MDADDLYHRANEAFVEENYELAAELFTKALRISPENSNYLAKRARCHIQLKDYLEAIHDATRATTVDGGCWEGHLQKGVACYWLGEYDDARDAFAAGAVVEPGNTVLEGWRQRCEEARRQVGGGQGAAEDKPNDIETAEIAPTRTEPPQAECIADARPLAAETLVQQHAGTAPTSAPQSAPAPAAERPSGTRHEWYQTNDWVVVGILRKGVKKESVAVTVGPRNLCVDIQLPHSTTYNLDLDLAEAVQTDGYRVDVLSTRVEIRLKKEVEGKVWKSLEKTVDTGNPQDQGKGAGNMPRGLGSSYWDKLAGEITEEEKNEKLEGDQAVAKLFQQIFASADEDTRRAMNKSFVESGGTVLSTNWAEVGAKKVQMQPPEGMVPKKFEI